MNDDFSKIMLVSLLLALGATSGCNDGDTADAPGAKGTGPLYALLTQVFHEEDRTSYVQLTESPEDPITLDKAREFPGLTNIAAFGGDILVSDGDQPRITRHEISSQLKWTATDDVVSFANHGLPEDGANFYAQWFVDPHTVYLAFDGNKRLLWDPTDFKVDRILNDSAIPLEYEGGLGLQASGNRAQISYEGKPTLQAFFYVDTDWIRFAPISKIAVYDPATHAEKAVLDAPCPGLGTGTRDEDGRTYFASWDYDPAYVLAKQGPAPCVVRVLPDGTLDASFTTDMSAWTDGRYSINFRYIGNGKGVAAVLHHEEMDFDFSTVDAQGLSDAREAVWTSTAWRLWLFDVEKGSAAPIEGIDVDIDPAFESSRFDGRAFAFLPYEMYGRTKAYEVNADGSVTQVFDTAGAPFKWMRVR